MAKDVKGQPWSFDAIDQGEGFGPNKDAVSVAFTIKPYVARVKVATGTGGVLTILSRKNVSAGSNDRYTVLSAPALPAGDFFDFPINQRVDGVYISAIPTGGTVFVYHGYENPV